MYNVKKNKEKSCLATFAVSDCCLASESILISQRTVSLTNARRNICGQVSNLKYFLHDKAVTSVWNIASGEINAPVQKYGSQLSCHLKVLPLPGISCV